MEIIIVSAGGTVLFILVATLVAILLKSHSKLSKKNASFTLGSVFSTFLS